MEERWGGGGDEPSPADMFRGHMGGRGCSSTTTASRNIVDHCVDCIGNYPDIVEILFRGHMGDRPPPQQGEILTISAFSELNCHVQGLCHQS